MNRKVVPFLIFVILLVLALVTINVITSNESPKVKSLAITTPEDTPVSIMLSSDNSDNDNLFYKIMVNPSHGTLSGTAPNLIYTPGLNFHGLDNFSFKASNGKVDSASAIISISVTSVNDPIEAHDDKASVQEDAPLITINVLDNDIDPDNDGLVVLNSSQPQNGSVTINTDSTLAYSPNKNFSGIDSFTYTVGDGKGATGTATVEVKVEPVNDAPRITSKPETTTRVWASYIYDVNAEDADPTDTLTYTLTQKPEGMKINPDTGLIEWIPNSTQSGDYDVTVEIADSNSTPVRDKQSFTITVASLSSPLTTVLTVEDGCMQKVGRELSRKFQISAVQKSDDNQSQTEQNSYTVYDFSQSSIPNGAKIISVVIFIEHYEQEQFPSNKLKWYVGSGWPDNPLVWTSTSAPLHQGRGYKATDSWDITTYANTPDKLEILQLKIENTNTVLQKSAYIDYIYVTVKWY
jgi:hypothetical protein